MICPFQNHVLDCSFKLLVLWPRLYLQRCWEGLGKESLYFPFMNLPRIEHKGLEVQGYIEAFWYTHTIAERTQFVSHTHTPCGLTLKARGIRQIKIKPKGYKS